MKVLVLGSGMMGRAIAYDLCHFSNFDNITIVDKDRKTLRSAEKFLGINFDILNVKKLKKVKRYFKDFDIAISAIPYTFNYDLANIAIDTKTHFLDLGGNNDIVEKEKNLHRKAKKKRKKSS